MMRHHTWVYLLVGCCYWASVFGSSQTLGSSLGAGWTEGPGRGANRELGASGRSAQVREIQVPLRAEAGGLWVTGQLGKGSSIPLMVDTGASVVVLPEAMARAAGVPGGGAEISLQTLHGQVKGRVVELPVLAVGEAKAFQVKAVVVPDGRLSFALLGRSFLSRFRVSIDLDLQQLVLSSRSETVSSAAGSSSAQGPELYTESHVERLQNELIRALRDPSSSPAYLRSLQSALAQWEQKRSR